MLKVLILEQSASPAREGILFRKTAYRKVGADDIIYYCGIHNGLVFKRNVTTGIETNLPFNVPNLRCSGFGMQWSNFSQSIVFAYEIDGYTGVAEIIDP